MSIGYDVTFAPLLPWPWWGALAVVLALGVGLGLVRGARGSLWRLLAAGALLAVLAGPQGLREVREPLTDVAVIVVDDSGSQRLGGRLDRTREAVADLRQRLAEQEDLEVRTVTVSTPAAPQTNVFRPLRDALADVPRARLAAVFLVTDGAIHDIPAPEARCCGEAVVHALITGRRDTHDRRLRVVEAPPYGIVGDTVPITVRVEDEGTEEGGRVPLTVQLDGEVLEQRTVTAGEDVVLTVPVPHAGPVTVDMRVATLPDELTPVNNRAAVVLSGIRDRLRVLLVSGEPHRGERVWRTLLKSDPAVDLVHFTILRSPNKLDPTPVDEMSLIAFPVTRLFGESLPDFDLVVFDRYHMRGVLQLADLFNVFQYVENGGALLVAVGPEFAGNQTVANSALAHVLPAMPTGEMLEQPFVARLTEVGRRHPITRALPGAGAPGETPDWAPWFRLISGRQEQGTALMQGPGDQPLLMVHEANRGRVAQVMTEQFWLWARGYRQGGPHGELLRRLAHWLMREPDLEAERLQAEAGGGWLEIVRHSMTPGDREATVTTPDGRTVPVPLTDEGDGRLVGAMRVAGLGVYTVTMDDLHTLVAVGGANPPELMDARATAEGLAPLVAAREGGLMWLAEESHLPRIERVTPGARAHGRGWLGVPRGQGSRVVGVTTVPLLPILLVLVLLGGGLVLAWGRESG